MKKKEGKLIVITGGEGVGKSTQIKHLAENLKRAGIDVVVTKEPTGKFREELLYGNPSPERELDLFIENRNKNFKEIVLPALKEGKWVLTDRSSPDTIAYQGYAREMDIEEIKKRDKAARQGRDFDLIILLDLDPEIALTRAQETTRFEKEHVEFHKKVREGYLSQQKEDTRFGKNKWLGLFGKIGEKDTADFIWSQVSVRFL